ncbi:helix-turn-helix transcriptional regulator [Rhizobium sp. R693]|uniref:helix-turn-helix domain-containing protein n=1 Tax=Rhizobium sp. R693 TaxID=1764276 RepID=UPI000B52ECBA|nr:helix-turn-helix transcriptional regulator [Rhizobium sp. R693]OWV99182.1 hypothetical protein ATY79_18525 [Rhizobium sp. R693]
MLDQSMPKTPDAVDVRVGGRIRLKRKLMGLSQTELADGIGVSFQQVQKYEQGRNRVGSSRLQRIADMLGVPVAFFFDEGQGAEADTPPPAADDHFRQFLYTAEALDLVNAFRKVEDANLRRKIVSLVKTLAREPVE